MDFWYEPDKPVLTGFSLNIKRGETIALVGPTGGGKSTIVNLVCRFYEPKAGTICIGGRDYQDLSLHAIQSRIGVVLQTPHLFSGTIRENIRYGKLDATDEEIEDAARLAGAHDFIRTLEKGYDEEVGEGGDLLSVGQKQLISLARAILAQPEIFIMDEATSSVDTLTEDLIQRGMEALMQDRTSFVIAHRLSTIKRADRILVIEDGRIAEMGSHAELLRAARALLPALHAAVPPADRTGVRSIQSAQPGRGLRAQTATRRRCQYEVIRQLAPIQSSDCPARPCVPEPGREPAESLRPDRASSQPGSERSRLPRNLAAWLSRLAGLCTRGCPLGQSVGQGSLPPSGQQLHLHTWQTP